MAKTKTTNSPVNLDTLRDADFPVLTRKPVKEYFSSEAVLPVLPCHGANNGAADFLERLQSQLPGWHYFEFKNATDLRAALSSLAGMMGLPFRVPS